MKDLDSPNTSADRPPTLTVSLKNGNKSQYLRDRTYEDAKKENRYINFLWQFRESELGYGGDDVINRKSLVVLVPRNVSIAERERDYFGLILLKCLGLNVCVLVDSNLKRLRIALLLPRTCGAMVTWYSSSI